MRVFGLTGGMASGKSTVAARFRARGVPVVDADVLARDVVRAGSAGLGAVTSAFGNEVLDAEGNLDRKKLGHRVFCDAEARRLLESILHPRIHALMLERMAELERKGEVVACYEAPLLVEVGLTETLRPLVVVSAPAEAQLGRAMARDGLDAAAARSRLDAQLPLARKTAVADFVIENRGSLAALGEKSDETLDRVLETLGVPPARYPRPEA